MVNLVDYKEFYEGRTINAFDKHNNHSLYYTLCSTLMNAFLRNIYAFIILEGYINIALIKDCIYLFDSHSRNVCGTLEHA
jgi:hypothetical protein